LLTVGLEVFTVTEFDEVFSGRQSRQKKNSISIIRAMRYLIALMMEMQLISEKMQFTDCLARLPAPENLIVDFLR
jgi:hypothetical protein